MNIFTSLKHEAEAIKNEAGTLYRQVDGHAKIAALVHRALVALEAFAEKEAPVVGAALGELIGGPAGAIAGAATAEVIKKEAEHIGAVVGEKVDAALGQPCAFHGGEVHASGVACCVPAST